MNKIILQNNEHLINSHWAKYATAYIAENYAAFFIKISFNGTKETILSEIARIGADEQEFHNGSGSNNPGIDATRDLMAKEHSYEAIRQYIQSLEK